MQFTILPFATMSAIAAFTLMLGGCGLTESRVREQIIESEARTASAQAQLEDRMLGRLNRADQVAAAESERIHREIDAQGEIQRRLVVDVLVRQRDALTAQARVLDEAIATLAVPRPLASGPRFAQ